MKHADPQVLTIPSPRRGTVGPVGGHFLVGAMPRYQVTPAGPSHQPPAKRTNANPSGGGKHAVSQTTDAKDPTTASAAPPPDTKEHAVNDRRAKHVEWTTVVRSTQCTTVVRSEQFNHRRAERDPVADPLADMPTALSRRKDSRLASGRDI